MVQIASLQLTGFRNLSEEHVSFGPGINWVVGPNGSGKTSILEALFLLSSGRSFRTHLLNQVIQEGQSRAVVFLVDACSRTYACQRTHNRSHFQHQGEGIRLVDIAPFLPILTLETDLYQIWDEGSLARRRWLNWGVFHAFPESRRLLSQYERALKQRNAALKSQDQGMVSFWDQQLLQCGEPIHLLRSRYWALWSPLIVAYGQRFLGALNPPLTESSGPILSWDAEYHPGWDTRLVWADVLRQNLFQDMERGFTRWGAHRADLKFTVGGVGVQHRLSRGEQKALSFALQLSQVTVLKKHFGIQPLLLIDDLPSELDAFKAGAILDWLSEEADQVILTAVAAPDRAMGQELFHVKQLG